VSGAGPCATKAVLLDALGTLLALQPPAPLLRSELERRFGLQVSEIDAQRAIRAEIEYYRAHLDEGRDAESLTALRCRCADRLRAALPAAARAELGDLGAVTEALLASLRFSAYADARPALEELRRGGLRLVVVSNWDVSLHSVLQRIDLGALLDGIVTSAEVGVRKPAPAIFEQALARVGAVPRNAVHVGDSPDEDVAGARNAGIEPILIRRDGGPGSPSVHTISSLADLRGRLSFMVHG